MRKKPAFQVFLFFSLSAAKAAGSGLTPAGEKGREKD